jgi:hypothetical protein
MSNVFELFANVTFKKRTEKPNNTYKPGEEPCRFSLPFININDFANSVFIWTITHDFKCCNIRL